MNEWLSSSVACGFRDESGKTFFSRGGEGSSSWKVKFRQFHARAQGIWKDLPVEGEIYPEHSSEFSVSPASFPPLSLGAGEELPSRMEWRDYCREIEAALSSGKLKKVVPARSLSFAPGAEVIRRIRRELPPRLFAGPFDGTYRFLLQWNDFLFFGASPELLFHRSEGEILFPAIAGTRAYSGNTPGRDLEEELLQCPKEREEHRLVVEGILSRLNQLGLEAKAAPGPEILRLPRLIHLYTPIVAGDPGIPSSALVEALHPTPAIGGYPQKEAESFLREHEPLDRGLFASPLLIRAGEREYCLVAIRSGLIHGERLYLFAGAGYVQGSHWEKEWAETGKKMDFLKGILERETHE